MTFNAEFEVFVSLPCQAQSGPVETAERCQDDLSTRHAQHHKTQTVRMYLRMYLQLYLGISLAPLDQLLALDFL